MLDDPAEANNIFAPGGDKKFCYLITLVAKQWDY